MVNIPIKKSNVIYGYPPYAEFFRYNFKEDWWQEIPPMLEARASPSVAGVNGKIYVFGGDQINEVNFYRARTTIGAAEVYDPLTNSWSHSEPLPESRSESGAVVI